MVGRNAQKYGTLQHAAWTPKRWDTGSKTCLKCAKQNHYNLRNRGLRDASNHNVHIHLYYPKHDVYLDSPPKVKKDKEKRVIE